MAERSTTPLPDRQAGPARADETTATSTQAPPDRKALALLSRLWTDAHLRWVLALFLLALVLRGAWVATINPNPLDGRFDDTLFYDKSAEALAEGKGYINFEKKPTARWPIGYSGLVASLYVVFGHNLLAPKALNVFLGAATVVAVYVLGARLFDRRVGLVAAALLALFPSQIFFSTLVMTEVLFAALLTLVALLVVLWTLPPKADPPEGASDPPAKAASDDRPATYKLLLLGLLVGYGAITRGEGGVVVLAVLLIWWVARAAWRPFLRRSALLLVGVAACHDPLDHPQLHHVQSPGVRIHGHGLRPLAGQPGRRLRTP